MQLYHRTLMPPTSISHCIVGNFTQDKRIKFILIKPELIELYSLDNPSFKLPQAPPMKITTRRLHANICAIQKIAFNHKSTGKYVKDGILLTLNTGVYVLLEYDLHKNQLAIVQHDYVFSCYQNMKNGLSKPIIGQYIAFNEKNRKVIIAGIIGSIKIYDFTSENRLQLVWQSENLQKSKSQINFQFQAPKNQNTLFYSIRGEYIEGQNKKILSNYQVSKDKNQVITVQHKNLSDETSHFFVKRTNKDDYFVVGNKSIEIKDSRLDDDKSWTIAHPIRSGVEKFMTSFKIKEQKEEFYIINDASDVLLIEFLMGKNVACTITYIQSLSPILSIHQLETNINMFLTLSQHSEVSLQKIMEEPSKTHHSKPFKITYNFDTSKPNNNEINFEPFYFPFSECPHITLIHNHGIICDIKMANPQKKINNELFVTGGQPGHHKGYLKVIRSGIKITQVVSLGFLQPLNIWTFKKKQQDPYDTYIVVSLNNTSRKTLSYIVKDLNIVETNELNLLHNQQTIFMTKLMDNSFIQVFNDRIRQTKEGKVVNNQFNIKKKVLNAFGGDRQLGLSMIGGFFLYFGFAENGVLQIERQIVMDTESYHGQFAEGNHNGQKYNYLILGKNNYHLEVYKISSSGNISLTDKINLKHSIQSLVVLNPIDNENPIRVSIGSLYSKYFVVQVSVDGKFGEIIQTKLDVESVSQKNKVQLIKLTSYQDKVIIKTPTPIIQYKYGDKYIKSKVPFSAFDIGCQWKMPVEAEGDLTFLAYEEGYLKFIRLGGFGQAFHQKVVDLQLTGRKIVIMDKLIGILCCEKLEHHAELDTKLERYQPKKPLNKVSNLCWYSQFLIIEPSTYVRSRYLAFDLNEKCISCKYLKLSKEQYLCFGMVSIHQNTQISQHQNYFIKIFEINKKDDQITFLYQYQVGGLPRCLEQFGEGLLAGSGNCLQLYEITRKKMILVAYLDKFRSAINSISTDGQKIFTTEVTQSFGLYRYNPIMKTFDFIADELLSRYTLTSQLLDEESGVICGSDKFGNIFISRLSEYSKELFYQEAQKNNIQDYTISNSSKFINMINFHVGEPVVGIQVGKMENKKSDIIVYATVTGKIALFYPFQSEEAEQVEDMLTIQKILRNGNFEPLAESHSLYRSYYGMPKGVVDGDFINQIEKYDKQKGGKLCNSVNQIYNSAQVMKDAYSFEDLKNISSMIQQKYI